MKSTSHAAFSSATTPLNGYRAIASTISKCEKVQPKLRQGTAQHTLLVRRIKALYIASALIKRELGALR